MNNEAFREKDAHHTGAKQYRHESWPLLPGFDEAIRYDLDVSRTTRQSMHTDEDVRIWIDEKRKNIRLHAQVVPLDRIDGWSIDRSSGDIVHRSGGFFTITGIKVRHRTRNGDLEWDQPIIDQPEIGILGILAAKIDGILYFCLQAKEEPGNIHSIQISPTVQATYSNYTRAHGGSLPPFIAYFLDPPRPRLLYAKLQTEDGGRFLFKSNRNMIILMDDDAVPDLPDGYIWLTLRQIQGLLDQHNLVNACARSVLAVLLIDDIQMNRRITPGHESDLNNQKQETVSPETRVAAGPDKLDPARTCIDIGGLIQWLDDMKTANQIYQKRIPLKELQDWTMDGGGHLVHRRHKYFKVIGMKVSSHSREVKAWCQPILDNVASGIIGLLVRDSVVGREYLMQAKAEPGNRNIIQIGPTVQFTQENYVYNETMNKPFLYDEFSDPKDFILLAESRQSEEGARFYQEEHVHRILMLPPDRVLSLPPEYRWFSADQVRFFLHFGEMVNSCARSILSCCAGIPPRPENAGAHSGRD